MPSGAVVAGVFEVDVEVVVVVVEVDEGADGELPQAIAVRHTATEKANGSDFTRPV